MNLTRLFSDHIDSVQKIYERALADLAAEKEAPNIDAVLIHSGSEGVYFGDDRHIFFEAFGHARHWLPLNRPDQMILMRPGRKPTYFQVIRPDFWYEQTVDNQSWWADRFDIVSLAAPEEVFDRLPDTRRIAFLGENTAFASDLGLPAYLQNEKHLSNYLDYHRGMKSPYEVAQVREANRLGMISHAAAHRAFLGGGSEWDIHCAYLAATDMIEHDCPYTNIVGLDEKAAILHYQNKRRASGHNSSVLLIDAGQRVNGYCADITRTYARDGVHSVFLGLLDQMDDLQLDLVAKVKPGIPYADIHAAAHSGVLDLLLAQGIVRGNRDRLEEHKVSHLFFPHGIGHLLGLQVHDVGGFFKDETGALAPPPEEHRFLRLNRPMTEGMIFTIEPGLYFIPVLLEPERDSERGKMLNWGLVDELIPLGGIRIEDNIHVTANGAENLTR